jgi:hypothetical protein
MPSILGFGLFFIFSPARVIAGSTFFEVSSCEETAFSLLF